MRLLFLFIVYFLMVAGSDCQISDLFFGQHSTDGEIWVLDSTHLYRPGLIEDVYLNNRQLVTSRNAEGKVTSGLHLVKKTEAGEWEKSVRFTQSYYDNGKKNEYYLQAFDSYRNIWIDSIQYKKHNNRGFIVSDVTKGWSFPTGHYTYGNKRILKYDTEGRVISRLSQKWNAEDEVWDNSKWQIFSFNNTENKQAVTKLWSKETKEWINSDKKLWIYNDNGSLIEYVSQLWKNDFWQNYWKDSYTYNEDKRIERSLSQEWDDNIEKWVNSTQSIYTYAGGKNIRHVIQIWDSISNVWNDFSITKHKYKDNLLVEREIWDFYPDSLYNTGSKNMYEYYSDRKRKSITGQVWNFDTGGWENFKMSNFTYNSGKTTIFSKWDKEKKEWVYSTYYKYVLDADGHTVFTIRKYWDEEKWKNKSKSESEYDDFKNLVRTKSFVFDKDIDDWKINRKSEYFWSKFLTEVKEEYIDAEIYLYPNPVSDILYIDFKAFSANTIKAEIFNSNGKRIYAIPFGGNPLIDVSQLNEGIYFLKISTNEGIVSKPFIVER